LAIDGKARQPSEEADNSRLGRLASSLTLKLVVLVGIFVALPCILYGQLEKADRQTRNLVSDSLRHRGWLIAQGLAPLLDQADGLSGAKLNAALAKFSEDGTILKLMLRPKNGFGTDKFFFMASAPAVPPQQTDADLDLLAQHGILRSLSDSCSWDKPTELRYRQVDGSEEILSSIIPINGRFGCWVLISAHVSSEFLNTDIGRPYWQTDYVRMAALIYLVFAVLALLMALSARRALRHFRNVAREIRRGGTGTVAFSSRNILPELASAAADFDRLVEDLRRVAYDIRRTAEDNAHAVKAPLAVIRSVLYPLRQAISPDDERSQRALQLIDSSVTRLTLLVSMAQRLGNDTADFIEAPKLRINLTDVVAQGLLNARDISAERHIRFVRRLAENVHVLAPAGILDIIIENILDNAIDFSPDGTTITTILTRSERRAELRIEDEGPGVDPSKLEAIFERNYSFRPPRTENSGEPEHAGLGLWIVRRHVEALGGRVTAENRGGGGLCLRVVLPLNGW